MLNVIGAILRHPLHMYAYVIQFVYQNTNKKIVKLGAVSKNFQVKDFIEATIFTCLRESVYTN